MKNHMYPEFVKFFIAAVLQDHLQNITGLSVNETTYPPDGDSDTDINFTYGETAYHLNLDDCMGTDVIVLWAHKPSYSICYEGLLHHLRIDLLDIISQHLPQ